VPGVYNRDEPALIAYATVNRDAPRFSSRSMPELREACEVIGRPEHVDA